MNRRRFIQSLAVVLSLPSSASLSFRPATAAFPAAVRVPAQARSWAVYMSALHGECTPRTLQNLLNIPEVDARKYVGQLVAEGVLKPNPLLQRVASRVTGKGEDGLLEKIKRRLDRRARAEVDDPNAAAEMYDADKGWLRDTVEVEPDQMAAEGSDEPEAAKEGERFTAADARH